MSTNRSDTTINETSNIKTSAPHKIIQNPNYNECDFLMSMLREHCPHGAIAINVVKPYEKPVVKLEKEKQTCKDISLILERCILDGHDCKTNLYKFNVLCKGDVDAKL